MPLPRAGNKHRIRLYLFKQKFVIGIAFGFGSAVVGNGFCRLCRAVLVNVANRNDIEIFALNENIAQKSASALTESDDCDRDFVFHGFLRILRIIRDIIKQTNRKVNKKRSVKRSFHRDKNLNFKELHFQTIKGSRRKFPRAFCCKKE